MDLPLRLSLTAVFLIAAVVLVVIAIRRNGLRGQPTSWRERALIYMPITVCVFASGMSLLGLW